MKISLCLLVFNELQGCLIDVPNLPLSEFEEVYAIDGGSSDGTPEYLESMGIPVYRQPKKGLNAAYIHAFEKSTCDAVVVFFPKGTIAPDTLRNFRPQLEQGIDVVVASRNIKGAGNEEDHQLLKPRKWGVLTLATIAALLWRRNSHFVRDILHGYKGLTVAAFNRIAPNDHGLTIDLEIVIHSYKLRLQTAEFPVVECARPHGETKFKILPTGIQLFRQLWKELNC
jgi:hypothetical protein